jgi:hypothetical protein
MDVKIRLPSLFALALAACGGSEPSPKTPASKAEATESKTDVEPAPREAKSSTVRCEDGSCFACGEAVCLSGFYCAVAKSGHGCAWVPSCASKATCACLADSLREQRGCTCEEKEGGVFVTCDGASL